MEGRQLECIGHCLCLSDGGSVVKARVLTCVEGTNLSLLEQAIQEQRTYQRERDSRH